MQDLIATSGEIPLLTDNYKITSLDDLDDWKMIELSPIKESPVKGSTLIMVDEIIDKWIESLTPQQLKKIKRQKSLTGIPLPSDWIKVWRVILKEPLLRDSETNARKGRNLNSFVYCWNIWAEECIDKYLSNLEKELLYLVDAGYPYNQIGAHLYSIYGDEFWKKRKETTKTTPAQVVNNYLYLKMPTKIVRAELTDIALNYIQINKI